MTEELMIC